MPVKVPVIQTGLEKSIQQAAQKAGKNLKINMGPGAKSIESLSRPLGNLTGKTDEFTKSMAAANARVLAFGASVGIIAAVSKSLKELVTTTISVEKNLANINSILRQSDAELNKFKNNIFDIARNTGQTFDTVAEAALELSRQGLKAEEVTKRLNDALVLSRLSGLSAADSVAGLTAAINSFSSAGITSAEVLNKISAAAASAAVSDRDLIEGLKRSGAVAVASGVKFDDLIGIIAALQEKTARGGAVIGNSLKTIFTRIQDLDRLNTLQDLGVQVTDFEGKVLSSKRVIENLGPVFAKLDQSSKVNLADNLVGKFQIAPFLALMEDYNGGISRSAEVANVSLNASSEAYKRNEALSQTLAASINTATVSLKELANTLGEIGVTENLSNIIGVFDSVVSSIQDVLDGDGIGSKFAKGLVKGIGGILAGPGLALALVAIGKLLLDFAKFGAGALKTFFGLNTAAQKQAALQGQIAASLLNDKGIRSAILSIEKQNISEGEKKRLQTAFFTKALNEQLMVMQKMQGIARTIAPGVMAGTASTRGGRKGRAAGGFLPVGAESSDISRGVGGAPASAKPVVIPNFAFGGGKRGTMVANDSEYIVPNYANGGDAIFNQNMASSMGLPANARKVRAASGYIPNFARTLLGGFRAGYGDKLNRKHSRSDFFKGDKPNSNEIRDVMEKHPDSAEGKKLLALKNRTKDKGKRSYMANQQPNKSIMLVPQPMEFGMNLSDHNFKAGPHRSAKNGLIDFFEGPAAGISKKLKKGTSAGNKFKKLLTLDEDIQAAIAKGVNTVFGDFKDASGNPNVFKTEPNQITGSNVETIMEKGGPGALGAIKGATFEALMQAIAGGVSQKAGQLDVDFSRDKGNILDLIFGIEGKGFKYGDFKNNIGLKSKFARQVTDNVQGKVIVGKNSKTVNSKTAASGYIPNFAEGALENAIGREKAAGLPVSQIRINQSGKLRNAQNPQGLAVTNTRDEPTGAIPNYAAKGGDKEAGKSLGEAGMKAMMLASGLAFVSSALSDTTEAQNKANKSLFKFTDVLEIAMTALMAHATLSMMGVKSGFKMGSKSAASQRSEKVAGKIQGFSQGKGGPASKLFSKLGPVAKLFGKMGPLLGRFVGFAGRFVPFIGPLIIGFQVISGIMKKFGVDFKGVWGMFTNALKKGANLLMTAASGIFKFFTFGTKKVLELIGKIPGMGGISEKGLSVINAGQEKIDSMRFETDTFGGSLQKAQEATAKRKAESDSGVEEKTDKQLEAEEKKKELAKQIENIKLSTAKQALDSQLKLAKLELTRKGDAQIALERAKALKTVSFERLQTLERASELEKFNAETSGLLLDNIISSAQGVDGLTASVENQAKAQKKIADAMKDGKVDRQEALDIATAITGVSQQNTEQNRVIATKIQEGVDGLVSQRGLLQDINQEEIKRRQGLEKELEIARQLDISLQNQSNRRVESAKWGPQFMKSSGNEEIQKLQAGKRGATAGVKFQKDLEIARTRRTMTEESGKSTLSGMEDEVGDLANRLTKRFDLGLSKDQVKKANERLSILNEILIPRQKAQNTSDLKIADANIKLLESGRELSTSFVKLTDQFDNFAINQRIQDAGVREVTGATSKARALARFEKNELTQSLGMNDPEERAKFLRDAPLRRTIEQRQELLRKSPLEIDSKFKDELVSASETFKKNIVSAFAEGITSAKDLKSVLLSAAQQFLKSMTQSYVSKWFEGSKNESAGGDGFFATIAKAFGIGKKSGGPIRGGSGTKDDVPAVLMGGEFVMNKKAVSKYGMGFMSALNNGAVQGFANGGVAMPGFQGAGAITGMNDLMSFATQTNDPGMENMTMFGRRNSKIQKRYQDAKGQAFGLSVNEMRAHEEAEKQKVSLGKMIASEVISAVVSYGTTKFLGGSDTAKLIGSGVGNFAGTAITGYGASSGAFGAAGADGSLTKDLSKAWGDITSIFSSSDTMEGAAGTPLPSHKMNYTTGSYATGGAVPQTAGVDTVPAMLSGGEFVMNSAATQRIGSGNLAAANAGGSSAGGDSTELVAKMEELITVTQESGRAGDINITINGSNGKESKEESGESNKSQRELSEKIKTVVKQVISDEKRLGGQLRK